MRDFEAGDGALTLAVFLRAVRQTASADYSPEQIAVWARDDIDVDDWTTRRRAVHTLVAVDDDQVIGFADCDDHGYIDMMFVDPTRSRQSVATTLLTRVVELAAANAATELTVHASITAVPFFARHGFEIVEERHPQLAGITLVNYLMRRSLVEPGQ